MRDRAMQARAGAEDATTLRPTLPGHTHGIVGVRTDDRGRPVWEFQCDQCGAIEECWPVLSRTMFYPCAQADGLRRICEPCHEASDCPRKKWCEW